MTGNTTGLLKKQEVRLSQITRQEFHQDKKLLKRKTRITELKPNQNKTNSNM